VCESVVIYPRIENCNDTTIKFTERLIAGTLVGVAKVLLRKTVFFMQELYNSTNVVIHVSPQDALPSVVIDKCSNIDLHFHQPTLVSYENHCDHSIC